VKKLKKPVKWTKKLAVVILEQKPMQQSLQLVAIHPALTIDWNVLLFSTKVYKFYSFSED
jgi:hypothetical protein